MTVRQIFSARAARPQVEALLRGLVRAAVFLGRADGQLGEVEVEHLLDAVRKLVVGAVGEQHVAELASVPRLLDEARAARAALRALGEEPYLQGLATSVPQALKREALMVAWRIVTADRTVAPREVAAFQRLAVALGFSEDETAAVRTMAEVTPDAVQEEAIAEAIEHLSALTTKGWRDAFPELTAAGVEVGWYDASIAYTSAVARLRVDLDAEDGVVNVHVMDLQGPGPHVICIYGSGLHPVLALLDRVKDTLQPATVPALLSDLVLRCDALFLERDGRLVQVHPVS